MSGATLENLYTAYFRQNGINPPTDAYGNILLMSSPIRQNGANENLQVGNFKVYITDPNNSLNQSYGANYPVGILRFAFATQYGNTPNGSAYDSDSLLAGGTFVDVSQPLPNNYYSPFGDFSGQYPTSYAISNGGFFANNATSDAPINTYSGGLTTYPLMFDLFFSFEEGNDINLMYQGTGISTTYSNSENVSTFTATIPNFPIGYDYGSQPSYTTDQTASVIIDPTLDPNFARNTANNFPWNQTLSQPYAELNIVMVYNSSYTQEITTNEFFQGQLTVNFVFNFPNFYYQTPEGPLSTYPLPPGGSGTYLQPVIMTGVGTGNSTVNFITCGNYGYNEVDFVSCLESQYATGSLTNQDPQGQATQMNVYNNQYPNQPGYSTNNLSTSQLSAAAVGASIGVIIAPPIIYGSAQAIYLTSQFTAALSQASPQILQEMSILTPNFVNPVRFFAKALARSIVNSLQGNWSWLSNSLRNIFGASSDAVTVTAESTTGAMEAIAEGGFGAAAAGSEAAEGVIIALDVLADI